MISYNGEPDFQSFSVIYSTYFQKHHPVSMLQHLLGGGIWVFHGALHISSPSISQLLADATGTSEPSAPVTVESLLAW